MTNTSTDEPVAAAEQVAMAGSFASAATTHRSMDVLRAIVCGVLAAGCVASPGSAPLLAPFIPALVAIRLLRHRAGSRAFLAIATLLAVSLSVLVTLVSFFAAVASALMLTIGLGLVHVRAAQRDPIDAPQQPEWPEPRLLTGLMLTIWGWVAAILLVVAIAAPGIDWLNVSKDLVGEGYGFYARECRDGGSLAAQESFCADILAQRQAVRSALDARGAELLAAFLALFAFGAAVTSHLIVLVRARRTSERIRPAWRLRELEHHWIAGYLVAAGLASWMLAPGDGAVQDAARAIGVGTGTLGGMLVISQGLGLAAWLFTRGRASRWHLAFFVIAALFAMPLVLTVLAILGMFDLALHPRRKALTSANLPGRGSGS